MSKGFSAIPTGARTNAAAVRVPKTAELVARQIRNAIIRQELRDGDTLPAESHLIAEFEVSRPTIREAVRILESEGLVTVSRGARGGARISSPNYDMIARAAGVTLQAQGVTIGDVYEMRTLVEPPAARLVAERNSRTAVPVLRRIIDEELKLVLDQHGAAGVIVEFHTRMIELAGNKTLEMISHALRGLVEAHLRLAQRNLPSHSAEASERTMRVGFRSHSRLVDLIEARDGLGAEEHWRKHMITAGKAWLNQVGPNSVVDLLG